MTQGRVFDRMLGLKDSATKSEKILISKIKEIELSELIYYSITELAEITQVAEATILRFCRKLGFKGFQDFKLMLSQDLVNTNDSVSESKSTYIASKMCDAIMQSSENVDYNYYLKLAKIMIEANKICVFAVGSSTIASHEAKMRLAKMGMIIENSADNHVQSIVTANLTSSDVLVLISVSGSTKNIIELAEMAKENNTTIISITSHLKSPLAKKSDYLLYSAKKEAPAEGGSLATVVAQSYVIDVLCTAIFEKLGEKAKDNAAKATSAVLDKLL